MTPDDVDDPIHRAPRRSRQNLTLLGGVLGAAAVLASFTLPWIGSGAGSSLSGFELADLATSGATGGLLPMGTGVGLYLIAAVAGLQIGISGPAKPWARIVRVGTSFTLALLVLVALAVVLVGFRSAPGLGLGVALAGVFAIAGAIVVERLLCRGDFVIQDLRT